MDEIFSFTIDALKDETLGQAISIRVDNYNPNNYFRFAFEDEIPGQEVFVRVDNSYRFPKLLHLTRQLRMDHIEGYFRCDFFLFTEDKLAFEFLDRLSVESRSQIRRIEIVFKEDPQAWRRKYDALYRPQEQRDMVQAMIDKYEVSFWRKVDIVDYQRVR